jgi:transcriptional repressor NrdR
MKCPACGHLEDRVVDSRSTQEGHAIRRRRECLACGRRFTTYESISPEAVYVIKRDGRREPFSRDKLLRGVQAATGKRPVSATAVQEVIDRVQAAIEGLGQTEVTSHEIGEHVMRELRSLDEVAYVRFASVYRRFQDPSEFMEAIRSLLDSASADRLEPRDP